VSGHWLELWAKIKVIEYTIGLALIPIAFLVFGAWYLWVRFVKYRGKP
jgi:hypothetical protein